MMMNAITKLTSVINYVRTKKGRIAAPVDQDICWTQIIALVQNLGRSNALPQPKTEYSGQMHMMDRYLDTNHVVTDTKVLNGSLNFTEALTKLKPETNTFTEADVNLLTAGELQTVNKILDKAIDDIELNTDTIENDTDSFFDVVNDLLDGNLTSSWKIIEIGQVEECDKITFPSTTEKIKGTTGAHIVVGCGPGQYVRIGQLYSSTFARFFFRHTPCSLQGWTKLHNMLTQLSRLLSSKDRNTEHMSSAVTKSRIVPSESTA
ncbi:hypothetical protein MAR_020072 [Mya arenaria]|uniref:Uncharacterized protein n=1 Tax=Mya arenaria TaxID=6604 RepID=A0ABY7E7H0_MYAAR|nr:hypothetical protein MAR_020072 [Mya arenaria]